MSDVEDKVEMFFVFQFQIYHTLNIRSPLVHSYRISDLMSVVFDAHKTNWDLITYIESEKIPLALYCMLHTKQHCFVPDPDLKIIAEQELKVYEEKIKRWPEPIQLQPFIAQYAIDILDALDKRYTDTAQYKYCNILNYRFMQRGVSAC